MVGNFILNLFLSGAMHYLWGLIHCLQIVTHFPLMKILMPANADHLFKMMIMIAQFNIVPLEKAIEDTEEYLGLKNDGFILSDNFDEFGYDSSDLIRNLQIMFIFMLVLVVLPLFFAGMRCLLFCNKAKKCLSYVRNLIFWNTYIRFALESTLELSIVSFIRMHRFVFDSVSAVFHSMMAMVLLVAISMFLIGSTMLINKNFKLLEEKDFRQKFGDLI